MRSPEVELDVLVAHELATCSPAAAVIWTKAWRPEEGLMPPRRPVTVERHTQRYHGGETDVRALAGDRTLLCENKTLGGTFEPGQVESYAEECRRNPQMRSVLIAPRSWLARHRAAPFDGFVEVEELESALREEADAIAGDVVLAELHASYEHRAAMFHKFAEDTARTTVPDALMRAFQERYEAILAEVSGRQLALGPRSLIGKGAGHAHVRLMAIPRAPIVMHKFTVGILDLRFRGVDVGELDHLYARIDREDGPMVHWRVNEQEDGIWPVLRRDDLTITYADTDELQASLAMTEAAAAMLALSDWLRSDAATRVRDALVRNRKGSSRPPRRQSAEPVGTGELFPDL